MWIFNDIKDDIMIYICLCICTYMYIFLTMSCAVGSTAIVTIPNLEKNTNSGAIKWLDINHPVCRAQCYEPHQPLLNYRGWWRWHCGSRIEKKENRSRKPCFQEHDVSCANESNGGTTFFDKMVFPCVSQIYDHSNIQHHPIFFDKMVFS